MLDRIPQSPPIIVPIEDGVKRPLLSVMIPTYNCFKFLANTLESVLVQDPGPDKMEINVVDDCSTDGNVEKLVWDIGKGRIKFFRQPKNVGSLRNFEVCINRSRGKLIHLLHGDDMVLPEFYSEIESLFNTYPNIGAAFTCNGFADENGIVKIPNCRVLEENGIVHDFLLKVAQYSILQVVAMVVKREVYENLGGFYGVHYGEDWEMWARIGRYYQVAYSPKCLAVYRGGESHTSSITSKTILTGQNFLDIVKTINTIQKYLPDDKKKSLKIQAQKNFSKLYAKASNRIYGYNRSAAFYQAKNALRLNLNLWSLFWVFKLFIIHIFKTIKLSFAILFFKRKKVRNDTRPFLQKKFID